MSLKRRRFPKSVHEIQHLFLNPGLHSKEPLYYVPCFYCQAKIDLADVRSGLRETRSISSALEIFPLDGDCSLTKDMVEQIDDAQVGFVAPAGAKLGNLQVPVTKEVLSRVETQFISYLMRHYQVRVYRNFSLSIYSRSGESLDAFMNRCVELLGELFCLELDALDQVFDRKLARIKEKFLQADAPIDFERARATSEVSSAIDRGAERVADLFLRATLRLEPLPEAPESPEPARSDLEESLMSLEAEARQAVARILSVYRERACDIDEYIIHPSLRDIHMVRTCVLWLPAKRSRNREVSQK